MKKIFIICLLVLLSVEIFADGLIAPNKVFQGDVITVIVDKDCGEKLLLERGEEVFSRTETFLFILKEQECNIGLLGVPSTLPAGMYIIKSGAGNSAEIEIMARDFINEDIPLNSSMTELRTSNYKERIEQSRILTKVILKVDTNSVFETDAFIKPVDELRVTSLFGDRRRYLYSDGTTASSIHNGIDYSAEPGTNVLACGDGRVVFADDRIISGLTVVIEHLPGVYSLYYHLNSIYIKNGAEVSAGELIGGVGSTGLSTGAHLHWEIRVAGVAVKPEPLMASGIIDKDFILSNIK